MNSVGVWPAAAAPKSTPLLRTCLSGLLSTLTARSHQTQSRLLGGSISNTTTSTSFQQNGITLARSTFFLSVPVFVHSIDAENTNFGDKITYFGFSTISHLSSIPHPTSFPLAPSPSRRPNVPYHQAGVPSSCQKSSPGSRMPAAGNPPTRYHHRLQHCS